MCEPIELHIDVFVYFSVDVQFIIYSLPSSAAVCHHLRKRDHDIPADVLNNGPLPRDVKQHPRVYEATQHAKVTLRESDGLRRVHLGADKRHRYCQGMDDTR